MSQNERAGQTDDDGKGIEPLSPVSRIPAYPPHATSEDAEPATHQRVPSSRFFNEAKDQRTTEPGIEAAR